MRAPGREIHSCVVVRAAGGEAGVMPPRSVEPARAPPRVAGLCYVLWNLLFFFLASRCRVPSQELRGTLSSFARIFVQDRQGSKEHSAKILKWPRSAVASEQRLGSLPRHLATDPFASSAGTRVHRHRSLDDCVARDSPRVRSGPRVAPLLALSCPGRRPYVPPYQVTNCIASVRPIEYESKSNRPAPLGGRSRSTNKRAVSRSSFPFRDPVHRGYDFAFCSAETRHCC